MPQLQRFDDSHSDTLAARYQRYLPIMEYLVQQGEFDLQGMKQAHPAEQPAFLTRLVNELVQQGWLLREDPGTAMRWNASRGKFAIAQWLDEKLIGRRVKASPTGERPRERLLQHGSANLKDSELIAILIRSGRPGESAVTAGEKVAQAFRERLDELPAAGRGELKIISPAIEMTAYCQIMAGIELGRRVAAAIGDQVDVTKITGTRDAISYCCRRFSRLATTGKQEEFHIVTLDTKNQVIDSHRITVGTLDASLVHPREVFRPAIKDAASSVLLVHNHPSGDPTPSRQDVDVTRRMDDAGGILGITVLDHIIVAGGSGLSIRECS